MRLQLALDCSDEKTALDLAQKAGPYVDIIEAGTPLIKFEGKSIVTKLKSMFPDKLILADLKTMDVGKYEADHFFDAGADIVTVLGAADDATIKGAVSSAEAHGKQVMVDLIAVEDKPKRARQAQELGAHLVGVHSGIDQQNEGKGPMEDLKAVVKAVDIPVMVAGGIVKKTIADIAAVGPDTVVVGGGITSQPDPGLAARELREILDESD